MSDVVEVKVSVDQVGPTASQGAVRDHFVTMDRPEAKGGENQGAMGGEVLLMALGGCFMSNLLAAAKSREVELSGVKLNITGMLASAPPKFSAITMEIQAQKYPTDLMQKLVTIAERGCIVANTLKTAVDLKIVLS